MDTVGTEMQLPAVRDGENILVVGGTGMLAPAVDDLLAAGVRVVSASRHASSSTAAQHRFLTAVDVDWADLDFVTKALAAVDADSLRAAILWVHSPYRDPISTGLHAALPRSVHFVRLWGSGGGDPCAAADAATALPRRNISEVFLGSLPDGRGGRRWLSHREISDAALAALRSSAAL